MLRTTNPSVVVSSAAAIAAEITAINSRSSVSSTSSTVSLTAAFVSSFFSSFLFANKFWISGNYFNKEIRNEMKISTTNTVPIPSSVFKPAFSIISPSENFALTVILSRYKSLSNTNSIVASRSLNCAGTDTVSSSSFASNV